LRVLHGFQVSDEEEDLSDTTSNLLTPEEFGRLTVRDQQDVLALISSGKLPLVNGLIPTTYRPWPKQQEFHRSTAKYRLFGGAAGPGKSLALLWEGWMQAMEKPKVTVLLLRRTFPELEGSLLKYFRQDIPWRQIGARYNESKHTCELPNGSILRFGYCQSENDVYQYQGDEFVFIGIDELTMFTLKMWQFLTSRNRCPVPGTFPCMAGATNPGNIGHVWVKSLWIDKRPPPGMENPEQYNPREYDFIPAKLTDNPIYANDESYIAKLRALPLTLRRMFLDGDWDVFAGQYFSNLEWSRHVIDEQLLNLEPWYPRWIGMDWGFAHPSCVHWNCQDAQNRTITYREDYGSQVPEDKWARIILERSEGENISAFYLSKDAFDKKSSAGTVAQIMGDILSKHIMPNGNPFPRPIIAEQGRVGGWRMMYQMLENNLWLISSACTKLLECLPTLIHDPDNLEDVLKVDASEGQIGDDAGDSARYSIFSRMGAKQKPQEVIDREQAKTIADPFARHFFLTKRAAERAKRQVIVAPKYDDPWKLAR
jgi:phage terminase large subunit